MLIANEIEIPNSCPVACPGLLRSFSQGNLCSCCPIFNCRKIEAQPEYADKDGMFCLVEPENYRKDWAEVWAEWFKSDMKEYPILFLQHPERSK